MGAGASHVQRQMLLCPGVVWLQQEELRLATTLQPDPSLVSSHISSITPCRYLYEHRLGPQSCMGDHTVGNPQQWFRRYDISIYSTVPFK